MTAEEFLRDLALRVAPVEVPVHGADGPQLDESGKPETEFFPGLLLGPRDAERFLDLTGVRVE